MSDMADIVQIGELMFRIGKGLTSAVIKAYQNNYYGQHAGQASFQKLQKLCGSHISYLEIGTQDQAVFKNVLGKTLDKYQVLYSPLADLNLSDGRSQVAFNSDQIEAVRAALNNYNADRLEKLQALKDKYGAGTEAYQKAKEKLASEMPEIRSMSAEDYVLTRFNSNGTETKEYQDLEASARDAMAKTETGNKKNIQTEPVMDKGIAETIDVPVPDAPTTDEKVIQFASAKRRIDYESLLKEGKAQRLQVADFKTEYMPIAGKEVPFFHASIDKDTSVVLTQDSLLDKNTAVLINDKKYNIINSRTNAIGKMAGKDVSEKLASMARQKAAQKLAKETAKAAIRGTAKAASLSNPVTAIGSAAESAVKLAGKVITHQQRVTEEFMGLDEGKKR